MATILAFSTLCNAEDWHFRFRSRNRVISAIASQAIAGLGPGYRVLELGCGNGNVIRFLQTSCADGIMVGMDLFADGLGYARRRGASMLVPGDVAWRRFPARHPTPVQLLRFDAAARMTLYATSATDTAMPSC